MKDFWKKKLTAFDAELCRMVESLTGRPCEPKNGGGHYFIEIDYSLHNNPDYIAAIWDAVEGRTGDRMMKLEDKPERQCLVACILFHPGECKDAAFVPKVEK